MSSHYSPVNSGSRLSRNASIPSCRLRSQPAERFGSGSNTVRERFFIALFAARDDRIRRCRRRTPEFVDTVELVSVDEADLFRRRGGDEFV